MEASRMHQVDAGNLHPTSARVRVAAVLLSVAVLALYLATLSPGLAMWDAGEYIAAASSLGIPHQPGSPLFVLIANVAGKIPVADSFAVRINLLAAVAGALSAGIWFLCAERLLRAVVVDESRRIVAAAGATLLGAVSFTVWNQSVVMEKVYPLALVGLALVSWLVLVWLDAAPGRRPDRLLLLIAYLTGLIYTIHPAGLLTAPAAVFAILRHRPSTLLRWRLIALAAVAFLGGTTPFAFLAIRAAHDPYVNESAVSACESGRIAVGCTFSAETARRLQGTIAREQYGGNAVLARRGPFSAQVGMFWLYFKWQWLRDAAGTAPRPQQAIAVAMLLLGLAGLFALRAPPTGVPDRKAAEGSARPGHLWYFGTLALTFTIALVYYLNFRYGASQSPELADRVAREPRDRDYFFMWTFSLWGLLAGLGIAAMTRRVHRGFAVIATAAIVLVPLTANWRAASRSGQEFSVAWARDFLTSLEQDAIVITNGDNDSFPLWYAQEVEGVRRDVTVTINVYLGMEWYARQMNRRASLWKLSDRELDSIPPYYESRIARRFEHGAISATLDPGILTRDQLLVLRAIQDSFPARPIYFSGGGYASSLGLAPYMMQQGFVSRLMPEPVREGPDTVNIGGQWIDVPRSLELWEGYAGARQMVREGRWGDTGSQLIPIYYAIAGQQLALALQLQGREEKAAEVMLLARDVAEAAQRP